MADELKEETTNKVLETMIAGLSKLTDERFSNIDKTLIRMENANLVTMKAWTEKEKSQDDKIESLILDKATMKGQISTLKIGGSVMIVLIGIAEFIISRYWN